MLQYSTPKPGSARYGYSASPAINSRRGKAGLPGVAGRPPSREEDQFEDGGSRVEDRAKVRSPFSIVYPPSSNHFVTAQSPSCRGTKASSAADSFCRKPRREEE